MPLTHSLFTGLSGMNGSSRMLDVVGNNIANVNTTAFKRNRLQFETQILDTIQNASAPNNARGGSNPAQIGLGVRIGSITRDFGSGALQPTGVATDMAIQGNGFFLVDVGGQQLYTRAGNFTLDRDFDLVTAEGARVQGYGVDNQFEVVEGLLTNINIPIGKLTIAQETDTVNFAGNLHASGDLATSGSLTFSEALYSDPAATVPITAADALTSIYDADGNQLFSTDDVITFTGARKGGVQLGDRTFHVDPTGAVTSDDSGTTVQDLLDFYEDYLGIDTSLPGGGLSVTALGELRIEGNYGKGNAIDFQLENLKVNVGSPSPTSPLNFTTDATQTAVGESAQTTFVVYDSLGTPLTVTLNIVYESSDNSGTTWRFFAESEDTVGLDRRVGNGTLFFDTQGRFISATNSTVVLDRSGTGATSPLQIDLDWSKGLSAYDGDGYSSSISATSQDGFPIGTLEDFEVSTDGIISGVFSNGLIRTLGQVPLAMFSNNEGLEELGGSLYRASNNSGVATIVTATTGGSGSVLGRNLELSNVELTEEFINIISASTGFSANSRVITTSDELLNELLSIVR